MTLVFINVLFPSQGRGSAGVLFCGLGIILSSLFTSIIKLQIVDFLFQKSDFSLMSVISNMIPL